MKIGFEIGEIGDPLVAKCIGYIFICVSAGIYTQSSGYEYFLVSVVCLSRLPTQHCIILATYLERQNMDGWAVYHDMAPVAGWNQTMVYNGSR